MEKLHIRRNDTVEVISGDSKGVRGKVIATSPEEGKVIVSGANIVSKHKKARQQGENSEIVKTEGALYACKVMLVCPNCNKAIRPKAGFNTVGDKKVKIRLCPKCNKEIKAVD